MYEDEGDNYDYERGAYSLIPMHWDDKAETLTIGDRRGNFSGMLQHKIFRVLRVTDARGFGVTPESQFDATVEFDGKAISVRVPLHLGKAKLPRNKTNSTVTMPEPLDDHAGR